VYFNDLKARKKVNMEGNYANIEAKKSSGIQVPEGPAFDKCAQGYEY
jgi:hypothetical protein